ncbi:CHAT domain-containing protein [bacterium]|nr:CHAT domain-containing protein [bacterium]
MTSNPVVGFFGILLSAVVSLQCQVLSAQDFSQLQGKFFLELGSSQYANAESTARQMMRQTDGNRNPESRVMAIHSLCMALLWQSKFTEAEKYYREATQICEQRLPSTSQFRWMSYNMLGDALMQQDRFREADQWMQKALQTSLEHTEPQSVQRTASLVSLGQLYMRQRDYARAEPILKQSLQLARQSPPQLRDQALAAARVQLGKLYSEMRRPADSEPMLREAVRSLENMSFGQISSAPALINALSQLGTICVGQLREDDAEQYFRKAIEVAERNGLGRSPQIVDCVVGLAVVCLGTERSDEATALFRKAAQISGKSDDTTTRLRAWLGVIVFMKSLQERKQFDRGLQTLIQTVAQLEKSRPADDPSLIALSSIAATVIAGFSDNIPIPKDALDIADRLIDRAMASRSGSLASSSDYETRATLRWARGDRETALQDLRKAIETSDQLAVNSAGTGFDVARVFSAFRHPYDRMVAWQSQLGNVEEAFRALEKSRARVLMAELQVSGSDLMSTLDPVDARRLQARRDAARSRLAGLRHRISRADQTSIDINKIQTDIQDVQKELVNIERDICSSSRAFRIALSGDQQPVSLSELESWVREHRALFLEYSFGQAHSARVVIQHDQPSRVEPLPLPADLARQIDWQGERVVLETVAKATQIDGTSLPQLLARPATTAAVTDRLHDLWKLLIPEDVQERLQNGDFDLLVVSTDGPMANIPFSTLVVQPGEDPLYLLDVGPPILYCPSATVLANLASGASPAPNRGAGTALSVSVSDFGSNASSDGLLQSVSMSRKFEQYGGQFDRLHHTATESNYIQQVFDKYAGMTTRVLRESSATERNLRDSVAGKLIVHLATHGTSSQNYGNLFGGLLLKPGSDPTDPDDDGFLSLAEIPSLDLTSCELAILSACSTNAGPNQQSEGHWGLSRGFLTAGARRVVATDWVVDDEAAASLVSYFSAGVAQAIGDDKPADYAKSLHVAQKWVRDQEKWSPPHFWGSFVLVGTK